MTFSEKLKIILDLSGLTQEKLAQTLKVSFPTVNSWVHGKSEPRQKKIGTIEDLYSKLTGLEGENHPKIDDKKKIISLKRKNHKNILNLILSRPDIFDQLVLSLTYNTNRIEGSTLTEPQTAAILFDNITLSNKTLVEHLEVKNH